MNKFVKSVSQAFKWTSGILIGLTVLLNFVAVFMRYFFKSPIMWCEEVSLFMFVSSLSFSIVPMTYDKRAVKLDFFTDMMPQKLQFVCSILVEVISAAALGITAYLGMDLVRRSKYRFTPILSIPYKLIYLVTVIGMAVSALILVYQIYADISGRNRKEAEV